MLNNFKNLSCYEEFEIQSVLMGISKIDILRRIGHQVYPYYFFISDDGVFNWYDLEENHVKDPGILKVLNGGYIPNNILKCIIPDSVTSIDNRAFSFCKSLTSITIPDSVTSIGDYAFSKCESLTTITIPNSVTSIGDYIFFYCKSLTSITIPNNITRIGEYAFSDCKSLTSISIPDNVLCICDSAFFNCKSLTSISIPNSVSYIGDDVFWFCNSLKEVIFNGKTLEEVKQMNNYPFGIEDESIIKCEI